MSYFVNPLRLNYQDDKYVLNKVIVFLSRSPYLKNVLILFPIFLNMCEVHPLLFSFDQFASNHENYGKKYKIDNNQLVETGELINQYGDHFLGNRIVVLNNTLRNMASILSSTS
jgi:hypothetical protein